MNIETKTFSPWMVAALTGALLALLACGASLYRFEESATLQQAEDQFAAIAQLKVDQIITWRAERLGDAAILTENPFLATASARFLADPDRNSGNAQELRRYFLSLQAHYQYSDILLVDPEGEVHLSLGENSLIHAGYAAALAEALRERKPVFTDLHTEEHYPAPHISVVAPFFAGAGQAANPLGAIVLVSDAKQFLYPLIQSWPTPSKTAETLLIRRDGESVLFLNDLRHQADAALKLRIPLSRTDVPAVMAVLGQEGFVEGLDYRGVATVAVVQPIPDSPWFIVAKDETAAVFAGWRFLGAMILGLFAALTAVLGAIGLVVRNHKQKAYYRQLYSTEAELRASVERHSITLKAVGDGVVAVDTQGRVELLNPVAEALTGWSHEEACGRPMADVFRIINEKTREVAENPVVKVLREGVVVGLANHTLLIDKNGIERPIADSAAPIRDNRGDVTGVVLVFRDQTEERRARRLIQVRLTLLEYASTHSLEELLTKALDEIGALAESPIGFYHFVDADQKTLHLQQWSTRTLKEFCRAEGRGMHYAIDQAGVWADCVREGKPVVHNDYASLPYKRGMPAGHAAVIRELVVPVMKAGRAVAILGVGNKPTDYTEKDIETVSYLADVTWQLIEHKHTEEVLQKSEMLLKKMNEELEQRVAERTKNLRISMESLQQEIDSRKRTEERLQATLVEVERSNKDLEQFAYVASHDLQEPLRMVSSFTQLLAQRYEGQLDDKAHKFIGYAVDGAVRMQRLINDLLAYSRVSTQGKRFDTVDSHAVLGQVHRNLAAAIKDSRALIINDDLPVVRADATQLSQLLQNLIGNAMKFRSADVPRIHVCARDLGSEWRFSVKDNGIGIDEHYAEKVFVIFQRLHTHQEYPGTGIGLAVCKRIVERHGGKIWFESVPGKGSTFYFTLPKAKEIT